MWFDFLSRNESQQFNNQLATYQDNPDALRQLGELQEEIIHARVAIFREDCLRSLFFVVATAAFIYLFMMHKLKPYAFMAILGVLILFDLWGVDKRYLNNEKNRREYNQWVSSYEYYNPFQAEVADREILKYETESKPALQQKIDHVIAQLKPDRRLKPAERQIEQEKIMFRELNFATNYRVFSLLDPFNNSRTSYYHKSIGGYHGAKLKRYQEIINFHLREEYQHIVDVINSKPTHEAIQTLLRNDIPVLNMLNTKYIIYNTAAPPIVNPYHYGNAWFAANIKYVENADQEILALDSIDKSTAIFHEKYKGQIPEHVNYDSSATIVLTSYKPNHLTYETTAQNEQVAVFSEIFYEDGWNVYLDGKKEEYFKANYILRAMNIPEGKHIVEFKFEPETYYVGRKISYAGSVLIILFVIGTLLYEYRKKRYFNSYKAVDD